MSNQFLKLRRSAVPGKIPDTGSLALGEIALNTYDGVAFMKKDGLNGEEIVVIGNSSGSFSGSFSGEFTGSLLGTASWAYNASTASTADNFFVRGDITGTNALFTGNITAQTLVVQTISSSVIYSSGSNIFGNELTDTQQFTGSVTITGSLTSANVNLTGSFSGSISNLDGITDFIAKFDSPNSVDSSVIYQSASHIAINEINFTADNPEALYVFQTHPTSINVLTGKGNLNNYLQNNIQNTNQGVNASSDVVATANNGNETSNYVDMGINSENYNQNFIGGPNDAYLYSIANNLHIGNANDNGTHLGLFVGGVDVEANTKLQLNPDNRHFMSGSLALTGSLSVKEGITGSLFGTSSWAVSASKALSGNGGFSGSFTGSFFGNGAGLTNISASSVVGLNLSLIGSGSVTASTDPAYGFRVNSNTQISGSTRITGSLGVTGSFSLSGSAGSLFSANVDTMVFTGSLFQSGSIKLTGSLNVTSGGITGSLYGTSSWAVSASHAPTSLTASFAISSSLAQTASLAILAPAYTTTASFTQFTSSYYADSSSFSGSISLLSQSFLQTSSSYASASGSLSRRVTNLESTASVLTTASASFALVSASYAAASESLSTRVVTLENASASFAQDSGSNSIRLTDLESTASVLTSASASFALDSGSNSVRLTDLESTASVLTTASASFALVSQSYSAFSQSYNTGSFTGSFVGEGYLTGSLYGTASWSLNAVTASHILNAISASYAATASSADNFLIRQDATASNLLVTNTITAQTLIVQTITSSVDFVTGSTKFGTQLTDTHQFTGSVTVTGSLSLNNSPVVTNATFTPFSSSISTRLVTLENASASFASDSGSNSTRLTRLESTASVLTTASASFAQQSGSNSIRLTNLESTASVLTTASASFAIVSSSYASASSSLSTRTTNLESTASVLTTASASFAIVSSSYSSASQSLSTRTTNLESTASVLTNASASFAIVSASYANASASLSTRTTNLESTASILTTASASFAIVSSSYASASGSLSTRVTTLENASASFAQQSGSNSIRLTNLESTASILTTASASFSIVSSSYSAASQSLSTRTTNLESTASILTTASASFALVSSSYSAFSQSYNTGSFTGSFTGRGNLTGSLFGTASWALNAVTASHVLNAVSASYAATASSADDFLIRQNATASNLLVNNTITAQTLVVQTITSSVDFVTGSTRFGTQLTNTHQFTGSVTITGSLSLNNDPVVTQTPYNAFSSSIQSRVTTLENASGSFSTRVTNLESTASVLTTASASFAQQSGSNSIRLTNLESTASVLTTASASFAVVSSSFAATSASDSTRITNLETTASVLTTASASFAIVSSSYADLSGSFRSGSYTGSFTGVGNLTGSLFGTASWALNAITASNALTASFVLNAISASFASTASSVNPLVQNVLVTGSLLLSGSFTQTAGTGSFGGPVGIGTITPVHALDIRSGDLFITGSRNLRTSFIRPADLGETIYFQSSGGTTSGRMFMDSSILRFKSSGAQDAINIFSNGRVGILQTSDAGFSFDVNGTTRLQNNTQITGSLTAPNITGSLFGTASWALNATTASFVLNAVSASFAATASSADNFVIRQNATASNLLVNNTITAQTLVVQTITSSVDFVTGSTRFGTQLTNTHQFTGSVSVTGSLSVNNSPVVTEATFTPTSSSISLRVTNLESTASVLTSASASFAQQSGSNSVRLTNLESTASVLTTASASFALVSSSYSAFSQSYNTGSFTGSFTGNLIGTSSFTISSSLAANSILLNGTGSSVFATTGSNVFLGNQIVTGSLFTSGSNTLVGSTTLTGSLSITGSTVQTGNNTLLGNTTLSGSIIISGTLGSTPSVKIYGDTQHNGYIRFDPVTTNINTSISASYIFVSGSTQDLYFSQNSKGYSNVTRLRWLEGNLYTGLLNGGLITSQSSTTYQVGSGSGIIVNLNASLNDNPYPTTTYVNWPNLTGNITQFSASFDQTFIAISSTGTLISQSTAFLNGQVDTQIPVGYVAHQNNSTINGTVTEPSLAYGWKQRSNVFISAFGPLKLSGFNLAVSGSSTGSLIVGSGTAFLDGGNYQTDPNNPAYVTATGTSTSRIFRYYESGSDWVYQTNGGAGFATIDPATYSNNGTLSSVGAGNWSIQRVFFFPTSPLSPKPIVVYYGNATYATEAEAISNIPIEPFTEAPSTSAAAIYLGAIVISGNGVFTNTSTFTIYPGGLFRQVGGSGGGGSLVTQTLAGLSDVLISGPTNGQPLVYNNISGKWQNSSTLTATLTGNADTATSASFATTASFAQNVVSSSFATTASFVTTAQTASYVLQAVSASFATTASNATTASFVNPLSQSVLVSGSIVLSGNQIISGSLTSYQNASSYTAQVFRNDSYSVTNTFNQNLFGTNVPGLQLSTNTNSGGIRVSSGGSGNIDLSSGVLTVNWNGPVSATPFIISRNGSNRLVVTDDIITNNVLRFSGNGSSALAFSSFGRVEISGSSIVTGSLQITGSLNAPNITGSLFGTSSWALNAVTSSYILQAVSASFASTASSADNFLIRQNATASNLLVNNTITAQTLVVQTITSSVDFVTGSTRFGSQLTNTHQFTGSVTITGSLSLNDSPVITNAIFTPVSTSVSTRLTNLESTASVLTTASASFALVSSSYASASGSISNRLSTIEGNYVTTGSNSLTGSQVISGSLVVSGSTTITGPVILPNLTNLTQVHVVGYDTTTGQLYYQGSGSAAISTASYALSASQAETASYVLNAVSSSFATTASYVLNAVTASYILNAVSASFAATASSVNTLVQPVIISGSLTVVTGSGIELQVTNTGVTIGNASTDRHNVTGSLNVSASLTVNGSISTNAGFFVSNNNMNFGPNGANSLSLGNSAGVISLSSTILSLGSNTTTQTNLYGSVNINSGSLSSALQVQANASVATGSFQTIASVATGSYRCAFFDYVAFSGSIARAGTVTSTWGSNIVEWFETYTNDVSGSTSAVTLQAALSGSNIQLQAGISGSAWTVRSLVRLL